MKASVKPHYDYARYIVDHGTPEEKRNCRETLETISLLLDTFEGGYLEPMDGIYLIDHLLVVAEEMAQRRWAIAKKQRYGDYQGKVGRTIEEERGTARGHVAAQTMLSLPLGKPDTKEQARVVGNIGDSNEAYVPLHNPVLHNLIVDPRTPDEICSWLVVPEGERYFRLKGWIKAEEAKQDHYEKTRTREGGRSVAYWVPPDNLRPVRDWWAERYGEE